MMRRAAIILFALCLTAALVALLLTYDFTLLRKLSLDIVAVLVLLSLVYSFLYGVGVSLILRSIGISRSAWRVFLVISGSGTASYLGNVQLGIPLRVFMFKRLLDIPYPAGAVSVALETACWFGLMGLGLLVSGPLAYYAPWITLLIAIVLAIAGYNLALPICGHLLKKLPDRIGKVSLSGVRSLLLELILGLEDVKWFWLAAALAVFCVNYAIDVATVILVVRNYGHAISPWNALQAVILPYLAGLVTMVPMGIGVRDVSMVALLTSSGVYSDIATTVALIQRLLRTVIPLIIGIAAVNILGLRAILKNRQPESC